MYFFTLAFWIVMTSRYLFQIKHVLTRCFITLLPVCFLLCETYFKTYPMGWVMSLQLNIFTQLCGGFSHTVNNRLYAMCWEKLTSWLHDFKLPCVGHTVLFLYDFPLSFLQHSHESGTETVQRLLLDWKERGREGVMESERKIMWTKFQAIECTALCSLSQAL